MKKLLLIATGGTIASEMGGDGLRPALSPKALIECVPELKDIARLDAAQLMDLDSTNMRPADWLAIARCVEDAYDAYDGFVVTHGTDTMAYTAAALTYLMQNLSKSVVLTGAQKSIREEDGDARRNLIDAFRYAAQGGGHGVEIVFDGKVIPGARARKWRTKSMNAFVSVDYPSPAIFKDGRVLRFFGEPAPAGEPRFFRALNENVFVLKLVPGMRTDVMDFLLERADALVIESFGVGGLPMYGNEAFLAAVRRWTLAGKPVVMTTQVPHEGSDMGVYQVGVRVKRLAGVLEAYDMTLEATVAKLMWILAQTRDPARVHNLFYQSVAHDLLFSGEEAESASAT